MKKRQVGGIVVLTPKGYLTGGGETQELKSALAKLIESGNQELIVNMVEVQHLNSKAVQILAEAHSTYRRHGHQMKLCAVDKRIENIFVITKLSLVFDVYPTEEQAIASFAESRAN